MDISKLSDTEVKALAYEQIALLEQTQANLRILNDEIAKRSAPKVEEKVEEVKAEDTVAE